VTPVAEVGARRHSWREVDGIVLLDKPAGLSSNQALQRARRLLSAAKGGHAGTLDPMATGMLPLCLGQATKACGQLLGSTKAYRARVRLGSATDTGDADGQVVAQSTVPDLDRERIEGALALFRGTREQVPPMYSALKRDGRPLYELARRGEQVVREPRQIRIDRLELLSMAPGEPFAGFTATCAAWENFSASKATYPSASSMEARHIANLIFSIFHIDFLLVGFYEGRSDLRYFRLSAAQSFSFAIVSSICGNGGVQSSSMALLQIPYIERLSMSQRMSSIPFPAGLPSTLNPILWIRREI